MLYLNARFNRAFRDLLRPSYTNWNNNIIGHQNRINGNYVRRINVGQAMMPYAVNNIELDMDKKKFGVETASIHEVDKELKLIKKIK